MRYAWALIFFFDEKETKNQEPREVNLWTIAKNMLCFQAQRRYEVD
jgi:hypothetical protein